MSGTFVLLAAKKTAGAHWIVLWSSRACDLDEPLDKRERRLGNFPPAAVDHERVPTVGHLDDLGDTRISLLALERRVRDRPRHGVVFLAGDNQHRPAIWIVRVDLCFGPWIQVCGRGLEERYSGGWYRKGLIEILGLCFAHRVREAKAELLERQRDRAVAIGGVAEDGPR